MGQPGNSQTDASSRSDSSLAIPVFCLLWLAAIGVAAWLFHRLEAQQLFLLPMWFDRPPDLGELADAARTALQWKWPALASLVGIGFLLLSLLRHTPVDGKSFRRVHRRLIFLLVMATLFDLGTTLWFIHARSLEREVHPGIRLFGYAFGRTTGPILAKGIQLTGLLALGAIFPRYGSQLFVVSAVLMLLASAHNVLN